MCHVERIQEGWKVDKEINYMINPSEFQKRANAVFPERKGVEDLLREYHTRKIPYGEVRPDNSTRELVNFGRKHRTPIHTTLYIYVSIPTEVYKTSKPIKLKPSVDFHGGGGFTGCAMFTPWKYLPRLKNILDAKNIVSIEVEYPLMPQSMGPEIHRTNQKFLAWLFKNLEGTLRGINPHLGVAWDSFNVSGHSFGGWMALDVLRTIMLHPSKPHTLRVKTFHGRSVLLKNYDRPPGKYMGKDISQKEANERAKTLQLKLQRHKEDRCVITKRSGSTPPDGMILAHCASVSKAESATWSDFWGFETMYDLLKAAPALPEGVKVLFEHGTGDINVPYQDTLDAAEMLRHRFPSLDIEVKLHEGKDHSWDYDRDPAELRALFELY